MTEERIVELRALCAEYKRKLAACEAAGLKDKAADIADDGVGRRALESLPELLAELESLREKEERRATIPRTPTCVTNCGKRMTFFQREQRKKAGWLASVCHAVDTQGVCPANITPSFWCPLGDDGICENVTADDWLVVLKKAEEKK